MTSQYSSQPRGWWPTPAAWRAHTTPDPHGDRGVTLVELMMVIAITSIVGVMVMSTIIVVGNLVRSTTERTEEFIDAKQALEEVTANLRGATNFEQGRGRLTDANANAVIFYTSSGEGLNAPPTLMSYVVHHNTLYHVVAGKDKDGKDDIGTPKLVRALITGIKNPKVFEFYTWQDPNKPGNKCFRVLTEAELTQPNPKRSEQGDAADGLHARNAIAGVKITLNVNDNQNVRYKGTQGHSSWVRLGESIEAKDPSTGALIQGWPQNCWEVFGE